MKSDSLDIMLKGTSCWHQEPQTLTLHAKGRHCQTTQSVHALYHHSNQSMHHSHFNKQLVVQLIGRWFEVMVDQSDWLDQSDWINLIGTFIFLKALQLCLHEAPSPFLSERGWPVRLSFYCFQF